MLTIEIPGLTKLSLDNLVLDYNGTLARDGKLIEGVPERLARLNPTLRVHVLTGDTFGTARIGLAGIECTLKVLGHSGQSEAKRRYVESIGASATVAIGNGNNDRAMLDSANLGIAVLQEEGVMTTSVLSADILVRHVHDALDLLLSPNRLVATMRD